MAEVFEAQNLPDPDEFKDMREWAREFYKVTERNFQELQRLAEVLDRAMAKKYTVTPPAAANRTLDATAATLAQTREVLGTLLLDMADRGAVRTKGQ